MRRHRQRCRRSVDRGTRRPSMEPRNRRFSRVPTRSAHAAGHTVDAVLARRRRTRRGRRPLAGVETRCAAPGRPCLWPDERSPGPHGAPTGHDRGGRGQGVGPLQSTRGSLRTKVAPRDRRSRGRAGSGPRGTWRRKPGAGPSAGVSCHRRSAAYGRPLWGPARRPEAGARCGSAARRDRCGGCRATGIPTATFYCSVLVTRRSR